MIGIVDYGAGNIFSLQSAIKRNRISCGIIQRAEDFQLYTSFIVPGVGHARHAMEQLESRGLLHELKATTKPVLGVCLGMQLLTLFSEESSSNLLGHIPLNTLGFKGKIKRKVPHMGWNIVDQKKSSQLFKDVPNNSYFYFVHSYFVEVHESYTTSISEHEVEFSSSIEKDNFFGVQFHPEKSGALGEQLLVNFSKL